MFKSPQGAATSDAPPLLSPGTFSSIFLVKCWFLKLYRFVLGLSYVKILKDGQEILVWEQVHAASQSLVLWSAPSPAVSSGKVQKRPFNPHMTHSNAPPCWAFYLDPFFQAGSFVWAAERRQLSAWATSSAVIMQREAGVPPQARLFSRDNQTSNSSTEPSVCPHNPFFPPLS